MTQARTSPELEQVLAYSVQAARDHVTARPLLSVAVAAGAGYVLAAGLPRWLVRAGGTFVLRTATRKAARMVLEAVQDQGVDAPRNEAASEATTPVDPHPAS